MKSFRRFLALSLALMCLCPRASAASATATPAPPPVPVAAERVEEMPETGRQMLDLAYSEWEELGGNALKRSNKYTKWRNNYEWGWCGGFITWLTLQFDIPQERWTDVEEGDVDGIVHVHEAGVGKILTGYMRMHRVTNVPQKGFIVVYGKQGSGGLIHVGLIYDVEDLGGGKYRLTTIEGNMSNTVKMYVHDYDMNAEKKTKNLSAIPKDEQTETERRNFSYKLQDKKWYINCFLMPWDPAEYEAETGTDTPDPAALITPTPAP